MPMSQHAQTLDAMALGHLAGSDLLHLVHGLIPFLRDVVEAVHTTATGNAGVEVNRGELLDSVVRLDFLANVLTDAHDDCAEFLREKGLDAPLSWGITVRR